MPCHDRNAMTRKTGKMAQRQHAKALTDGKSGIDCHQATRTVPRSLPNPQQHLLPNPLARPRPHRRRKPDEYQSAGSPPEPSAALLRVTRSQRTRAACGSPRDPHS
jgi:hypothetical protein